MRIAISMVFVFMAFCGFLVATGHRPTNDKLDAGYVTYRVRPPCCEPGEREMMTEVAKQIDKDLPLVTMR